MKLCTICHLENIPNDDPPPFGCCTIVVCEACKPEVYFHCPICRREEVNKIRTGIELDKENMKRQIAALEEYEEQMEKKMNKLKAELRRRNEMNEQQEVERDEADIIDLTADSSDDDIV